MFGLHLSYIFSLICLLIFGGAFFTVDFYLPKIRNWKSAKLFNQSKIYLDETIDNAGGLLNEGVRRGRIAHLLNPYDEETLFRVADVLEGAVGFEAKPPYLEGV